MSSQNAIAWGGLANNSLFFGAALAETTSTSSSGGTAGWNTDSAWIISATASWPVLGAASGDESRGGVFSSSSNTGQDLLIVSHRTILLGY
ncbi:hypothetical protein FWG76_02470 [Candidatus Saccharibacteria bacterium]|nr:hypothetical protein [Candidatus Saccharibacteria bacterium]